MGVPDSNVVDAQDSGPTPFDAGPPPPCVTMAGTRHILDRPGNDRVREPSTLAAMQGGGFLVGLRRYDLAPRDAGAPDAAAGPAFLTDTVDLIALTEDGSPRGAALRLYDGVGHGTTLDDPLLFPTATGAFVLFREQRGLNASDPSFFIRLRAASVDTVGMGAPSTVLREDYARPNMARLTNGNLLGVASVIQEISDSGIPTISPVSMYLAPDGTNLRNDVDINSFVPVDAANSVVRATDDGGAVFVARTNNHLGFLRFTPAGVFDSHGIYEVRTATIPRLDDAASAGDGIVGVYTVAIGARSEVHVIVAGLDTGLRLDRELESFAGEGSTVATAINAYGGVALLWRRGVDANARVRIAVIAPDGTIRVNPTDLVAAANIEGHILAHASGRDISFIVQDGLPPTWGYTFGRACIPGM